MATGLAAAAGLGLLLSNPDESEFETFAADQLVTVAVEELCGDNGLPLLARLVVRDCPRLIQSQRALLGKLALSGTQRRNFGLFSLYRTDLGGQAVLPDWSIPRYRALTLAVAGRFLLLPGGRIASPEATAAEAARP